MAKKLGNKRVFTVFVVIALLASIMAAAIPASALQPVTITLVGGTGTITKNQDDILAMPSTTGLGGTKSSGGSISNKGTYQGVSVRYLCELVGGIDINSVISVIDSTGSFIVNFTYQQVHDGLGFNTYNPDTGASQAATQPITLILAYSLNGSELSANNGPLRAVVVGSEGLLTDSSLWNKQVTSIVITNSAIPEYPLTAIFVLTACFATLIAFVVFKKGADRAHLKTRTQALKRNK